MTYNQPDVGASITSEQPADIARRRRRVSPWMIVTASVLAFLVVGSVVVLNAARLLDHVTVLRFEPSQAVTALANAPELSDEGRFLFLASTPRIESAKNFNTQCSESPEGSGILGCYRPFTRQIHLFAVSDPRLAGLNEVVSAHEMLHAAWDRMSAGQKEKLTPLLEAEASRLTSDAAFMERMEYYAKHEPGQRANELHSIIATEVKKISPALESHYTTYFIDRAAIAAASLRTTAVFTALTEQITTLSAQMTELNASIETQYAAYTTGYDVLNADISSHNARASWPSQAAIDRSVVALDSRQKVLDASYADLQQKTAVYEVDFANLNQLIAQTATLNTATNQTPPKELPPPAK